MTPILSFALSRGQAWKWSGSHARPSSMPFLFSSLPEEFSDLFLGLFRLDERGWHFTGLGRPAADGRRKLSPVVR